MVARRSDVGRPRLRRRGRAAGPASTPEPATPSPQASPQPSPHQSSPDRPPLPPTPVLGIVLPPYPDDGGPQTMSMPAIRPGDLGGHDPSTVTIGVVIDLPEPWASGLQSAREGFGDLQARAIPTHVTMLPPTAVPLDRLDVVVEHLASVARGLTPFDLLLEGTDTFRPVSPVVFVRVANGGDGCDTVQRAVRTGPLQRELTFPFHPHVTVAHHLDDDALDRAAKELADFSAAFVVDAFVLYEHGADGIWRPRRRFAFGAVPA